MPPVSVHPAVYQELEVSRSWYQERAEGLGDDFLDEIDFAVAAVRRTPETWPYYDRDKSVRRYLVHRFPFSVIYRASPTEVLILAVAHHRRRPGYWEDRLV